jgi:hypothetical protein
VRERRAGRTSITAARAGVALARTLLALVIVPLRATLADGPGGRVGGARPRNPR